MYGYDIYSGDDWGEPIIQSDYVFPTVDGAADHAEHILEALWADGQTCIGATIVSDLRDRNDNPTYEEEITPTLLGWVA